MKQIFLIACWALNRSLTQTHLQKMLVLVLLGIGLNTNLSAQEICGNGLDDDGNGLIDCFDPACSGVQTNNVPVAQISDDAEEITATGFVELVDLEDDLDFRPGKMVGIRFSSLAIPANATIATAYIRFVASPDNQSGATIDIVAERVWDGSTFSSTTNNISNRIPTNQSVNWVTSIWTSGNTYQTPSLVDVVQEVIGLASTGTVVNNIAFLFTTSAGRSAANSYETNLFNTHPVLFIEWGLCDSDGDGIVDVKDLDDDNDGITDVEEGFCSGGELLDLSALNNSTDPVAAINGANLTLGGATVSMSPVTLGGSATLNDYVLNDSHASGSYGPKIGILNANGATDFARFDLSFSPGLENLSFKIHDLDDEDQVTLNAYNGSTLYTLQLGDITSYGCASFEGGNLFRSICANVANNNPMATLEVNLSFAVTKLEIILSQQPFGDGGGSITLAGLTARCEVADFDNDGIPNYLDLDSDNDGITDILEAGGLDINQDGRVDYPTPGDASSMTDADQDGLSDDPVYDSDNNGTADTAPDPNPASNVDVGSNLPQYNSDGTGNPDFLDIDADDDGIIDLVEGQSTAGFLPLSGQDLDKDGLDDAFDLDYTGIYINPHNQDGTDLPDYRDLDTDNDGESDSLEGFDGDDNGVAEKIALGLDTDGDGLDDAFDVDGGELLNLGGAANNNTTPVNFPPSSFVSGERAWRATGGGSFPVEWLDFSVIQSEQDAQLSWATAQEEGSDYFEVQRSLDGQSFHLLGRVQAQGSSNTATRYSYLDEAVTELKVSKVFYRLRQLDVNGADQYSNTIELTLSILPGEVSVLVFPNPASEMVRLEYAAYEAGTLHLSIFNRLGQLMTEKSLHYQAGQQILELNIADWTPGVYVVQLASETHQQAVKLVKK